MKIWPIMMLLLAGCATLPRPIAPQPVEVQILAINDFHGNLEPPGLVYDGAKGKVPTGGAAYLATALKQVRTPASVTVAAGDLISASPLISSLYYDEPTVEALSAAGLDLAAVGNHEFDRGSDELKRMQGGGCRPKQAGEAREEVVVARDERRAGVPDVGETEPGRNPPQEHGRQRRNPRPGRNADGARGRRRVRCGVERVRDPGAAFARGGLVVKRARRADAHARPRGPDHELRRGLRHVGPHEHDVAVDHR